MAGRRRLRSPSAEPCGDPVGRRRLFSLADEPPGAAQDVGDEGIDLISQMPDSVLSCILSFLNVRDAVRARALSPRWRHLFPASTSLCFDLFRDDCVEGAFRFTRSAMIRHPGTLFSLMLCVFGRIRMIKTIKEFSLRCDGGGEYGKHLDYCISEISHKNVEEINFNAAELGHDVGALQFPFSLLLQRYEYCTLEIYSHLRHLSLESCTVDNFLSLAGPLACLRTLVLRDVSFHHESGAGGDFNHITFVAPHLENLTLEACRPIPSIQRLCAELRMLKALRIKSYYPATSTCPERYPPDDIVIGSSNIREFFFTGVMKDISFSTLNFLHHIGITSHEWTEEKASILLATLSKGAPGLKVLQLATIPLHCFQLTTSYTFKCLKELHLDVNAPAETDIQRLLRFLEYAPFLKNLNILLYGISEALTTTSIGEMQKLHSSRAESSVHSHLKRASIKRELAGFGTSDLELALDLLKIASSLELIELAGVETGISFEIRTLLNLLYPQVEVMPL